MNWIYREGTFFSKCNATGDMKNIDENTSGEGWHDQTMLH
jgi:hypothetical protein